MIQCFFISDLHGRKDRYEKLFAAIRSEKPQLIFLGGDLLPTALKADALASDFLSDYLLKWFSDLRAEMANSYPQVFLILGNDDGRCEEPALFAATDLGLIEYIHGRKLQVSQWTIYGYAYVPPTPFLLKDWERYDVSRYVDPGCISPEEGIRTVPISGAESQYATIQDDLEKLAGADDLSRAIFLFHSPPYQSKLDRAALDGKKVDHAPLDVHVGSIAIRRFIESRQPLLTLHGHIHEAARLTGSWRDQIGRTLAFSAAHDGPELALVRFDLKCPGAATRELL